MRTSLCARTERAPQAELPARYSMPCFVIARETTYAATIPSLIALVHENELSFHVTANDASGIAAGGLDGRAL